VSIENRSGAFISDGYYILASFILRTLSMLYSELPQNLGKTFKLTYAKLLKCLVWLAGSAWLGAMFCHRHFRGMAA
jgi:hypothetical protein